MPRYLFIRRQKKDDPFRFYIYAYLRSKDSKTGKAGTPYYLGKGCGKRAWQPHGGRTVTNKSQIVIIAFYLTEVGALALERRYIEWYGRVDNKTGILRNYTDGGEGGGLGRIVSDKEKEITRNRTLGTVAVRDAVTGVSLGAVSTSDPKYISGEYIPANRGIPKWEDGSHPKGMLGKTHTDANKANYRIICGGENNPMFGKKRPEVTLRNKDPVFITANTIIQKINSLDRKAVEAGYFSYENLCDAIKLLLEPGAEVFKIITRRSVGSKLDYLGSQLNLTKRQTELLLIDLNLYHLIASGRKSRICNFSTDVQPLSITNTEC